MKNFRKYLFISSAQYCIVRLFFFFLQEKMNSQILKNKNSAEKENLLRRIPLSTCKSLPFSYSLSCCLLSTIQHSFSGVIGAARGQRETDPQSPPSGGRQLLSTQKAKASKQHSELNIIWILTVFNIAALDAVFSSTGMKEDRF